MHDPQTTDLKNLKKSTTDKMLGGVCGGLANATPLPSWLWRVIFILLALSVGTGILAYILMWLFMPKSPHD